MQRTAHEILSLAAYLPFVVLPEGVTQDIMEQIRQRNKAAQAIIR